MIQEFISWWIGQLADLVPPWLRRFLSSRANTLVIAPIGGLAGGGGTVAVYLRRAGREVPVGQFGLTAGELAELPRPGAAGSATLRLAQADVLGKTVTLPLAAERQLAQALAFEMDRETPFSAEEVFWTYRIVSRDRQRGQLSVRLVMVPRAGLVRLLASLREADISPQRAEVATGPDQGCWLQLNARSDHLAGPGSSGWLRWSAAAVSIGLAAAVAVTPFVRQAVAMARLDNEIAAGRVAASEVAHLRKEIDRLLGKVDFVETERAKGGRPLLALAVVTRMLPDDCYLTEVRQQQNKLVVSGRSPSASRLIAVLATEPHFRNPFFAAPVTRIEASRLEMFTIAMEVVP